MGNRVFQYIEFNNVFAVGSIDASTIQESFLRDSEIVDDVWIVNKNNSVHTPIVSQISFENGVVVLVEPEKLVVTQSGVSLSVEENLCSVFALRYSEVVPLPSCVAIGFTAKKVLFCERDDDKLETLDVLKLRSHPWISFRNSIPKIRIRSTYEYSGKTLNLTVADVQRGNMNGVLFQGHFHRNLEDVSKLGDSVNSWIEDLDDLDDAITSIVSDNQA